MKVLFSFLLIFTCIMASAKKPLLKPDPVWIERRLKEEKFPSRFISDLEKQYDPKSYESVIKLNILGFLGTPNHMKLISPLAVSKTKSFVEQNQKAFGRAKQDFGLDAHVIAALLWIETRHGDLTGRYHVPSVYLHLLQAARPQTQRILYKIAKAQKSEKKFSRSELKELIKTRTEKKSAWALEQLAALKFIHAKKISDLKNLRGSFAGAFGMPQFIPSSYKVWALTAREQEAPNLFDVEDSIFSVANYLSIHGWQEKDVESHVKALMGYNNSLDYAQSILEIAEQSRGFKIPAASQRPKCPDADCR